MEGPQQIDCCLLPVACYLKLTEGMNAMLTYQDFEAAPDRAAFVATLISQHMNSEEYRIARDADLYERCLNVTINRVTAMYSGKRTWDESAQKSKIATNAFHRLNTQRVNYLLGNGVSFTRKEERLEPESGRIIRADLTKEAMGPKFDSDVKRWAYDALIHRVAFAFVTEEGLSVYPLTAFAPLWDEMTGTLRAGVHFWRIDKDKPMYAELYTETGRTDYRSKNGSSGMALEAVCEEQPYSMTVYETEAEGVVEVAADKTASRLPVVAMWGSRKRQSTLVELRPKIDAYDLINSGFADTERDCAKIYWLIENCGGMDERDMQRFLEDIREKHIAQVDSTSFSGDARAALTPYTQETPYQGTKAYLDHCKAELYDDFGALDVHTIAAGSTNDHIDAAYQPLDEEADDLEYCAIEAIQQVLALRGIEDTPQFKRNRVSNTFQTIQGVMLAANVLGQRKTLEKLPIVTVDEVDEIMADNYGEEAARTRTPNAGEGETD